MTQLKAKKYSVSFSGGKDSTAMLLRLLEEGRQVDDVVFFDTGWEFPQMLDHIADVEQYIGRSITILHPKISFTEMLVSKPVVARKGPNKNKVHRIGYGWPSMFRRWCTRSKIDALNKNNKNATVYVGIASDETKRIESASLNHNDKLYPLIEWDMTEDDCLRYCRERGFTWGGLYNHFKRASCFCCPLQRLSELKNLRKHYQDLWSKMLEWDAAMGRHNKGFKGYETVHDLEKRFAYEDCQLNMFEVSVTV